MSGRPPFVVLGLGNELFTDEGVGPAAARRMDARVPPTVEVVDGGTLGVRLLPEIEGREGLLLLDAVVGSGLEPGTVLEIPAERLYGEPRLLFSAHQVGVAEALVAAELAGRAPGSVAAVGMVPASLETGYGLSEVAAARLDEMVRHGLAVLAGWGAGEVARAGEVTRAGEAARA